MEQLHRATAAGGIAMWRGTHGIDTFTVPGSTSAATATTPDALVVVTTPSNDNPGFYSATIPAYDATHFNPPEDGPAPGTPGGTKIWLWANKQVLTPTDQGGNTAYYEALPTNASIKLDGESRPMYVVQNVHTKLIVKLTANNGFNAYSWEEMQATAGGGWAPKQNGLTGNGNAVELNRTTTDRTGSIVELGVRLTDMNGRPLEWYFEDLGAGGELDIVDNAGAVLVANVRKLHFHPDGDWIITDDGNGEASIARVKAQLTINDVTGITINCDAQGNITAQLQTTSRTITYSI